MRVLIVNTSEKTGGAALAANRLKDALNNNGVKTKMLVRDKESNNITIVALPKSPARKWHFLWERWCIFWHLRFKKQHLWELDSACCGTDITSLPEFKEADIIHLSWINQGMLSLKNIKKILESGKPVVWTMHDIWPATSICHLTLGCEQFKTECKHCKYLPGEGSENDFSTKVWNKKKAILNQHNISFVACSHWLESEAKQSSLLTGQRFSCIPNPIDTHVFRQKNKQEARLSLSLPTNKRLILFVSQRVTNVNKGMNYLIEAINKLAIAKPEMQQNTGVVILGGHAEEVADKFSLPVFPMGYVSDAKKIVNIYNASDLFVLPSLSENLPNTIMEAMACGVPCIGFNVGGIPEEIDHKVNGYVAEYKNTNDLAKGIHWVLDEADYHQLSKEAENKVSRCYSQQAVAMKYLEVYEQALAERNKY